MYQLNLLVLGGEGGEPAMRGAPPRVDLDAPTEPDGGLDDGGEGGGVAAVVVAVARDEHQHRLHVRRVLPHREPLEGDRMDGHVDPGLMAGRVRVEAADGVALLLPQLDERIARHTCRGRAPLLHHLARLAARRVGRDQGRQLGDTEAHSRVAHCRATRRRGLELCGEVHVGEVDRNVHARRTPARARGLVTCTDPLSRRVSARGVSGVEPTVEARQPPRARHSWPSQRPQPSCASGSPHP